MTSPAESIIQKIFETAGEDERVGPALSSLRDAFVRGEWNPSALAEIVEEATTAETGADS